MASGATYTPIASTTIGTAVASYTFSSISGSYTDLVLITYGKSTTADNGYALRFNGTGGSGSNTNYSTTYLYGDGSTAASTRVSNSWNISMARIDNTMFATGITHIMNYSNSTTYKTVLTRGGDGSILVANVGLYRSTSAITQIQIEPQAGGNFDVGSTFALYGITAA